MLLQKYMNEIVSSASTCWNKPLAWICQQTWDKRMLVDSSTPKFFILFLKWISCPDKIRPIADYFKVKIFFGNQFFESPLSSIIVINLISRVCSDIFRWKSRPKMILHELVNSRFLSLSSAVRSRINLNITISKCSTTSTSLLNRNAEDAKPPVNQRRRQIIKNDGTKRSVKDLTLLMTAIHDAKKMKEWIKLIKSHGRWSAVDLVHLKLQHGEFQS